VILRRGVQHWPLPPKWQCGACNKPGLCEVARARLRAQFPDRCRCELWWYVFETLWVPAVRDLPDVKICELYDRFMHWITQAAPEERLEERRCA
jgi:hypothetical protein